MPDAIQPDEQRLIDQINQSIAAGEPVEVQLVADEDGGLVGVAEFNEEQTRHVD